MLTQRNLVDAAEDLARRVPLDAAYDEERDACWVAVGEGRLRFGDSPGAVKALGYINHPPVQAVLRFAICKWFGENPGDPDGSALLSDTVEHIGAWQEWFCRRDIAQMVPAVHGLLGETGVRKMAAALSDPFNRSNVLVKLARLQSSELALETLHEAERICDTVRPGDRDFAYRWVLNTYAARGDVADEARVRLKMTMKPDQLDPPKNVEELLKWKPAPESDEPVDTLLDRASRLLHYQFNDLKVRFLIELATSGGLSDEPLEELISSDRFRRIEPARPRDIRRPPPLSDDEEFARFLFARPTPAHQADKDLLDGDCFDEEPVDPIRLLERAASLFRNFGEIGPRFSMLQVDQGLWYLFSWRLTFLESLFTCQAPLALQQACVRAMLCPFRDYYAQISGGFPGTFFYMWWDVLRDGGGDWEATEEERRARRSEVEHAMLQTLSQILSLPDLACRDAALHGLNHLHSNPDAIAIVAQYLDERRGRMAADEIRWIEACRDGKVL